MIGNRGGGFTEIPFTELVQFFLPMLLTSGALAVACAVAVNVAVTAEDARVAIPVVLGAGAVAAVLWRRWLLLAQAPTTAQLAALHPAAWDVLFLALAATTVLMGTTTMGVVLVLVLLFLPAAAALPWGRRLPGTMVLAVLFGLLDAAVGFYLSNRLDWPFSQSVGGVGFAMLVLSHLLGRFAR